MKKYLLKSAEYEGKSYTKCVLILDEASGQAEVQSEGRLGRKTLTVAKLRFDAITEVRAEGSALRVGKLSVVTKDEEDVAEIQAVVTKPAEARRQLNHDLAEAESSILEFLKLRETTVAFLAKLRRAPRGASMDLSSTWTAREQEPVDEFLSTSSKRLAESFERMNDSMKKIQKSGGPLAERLYAFVYCVGSVQDALLSGEGDLSREIGFLRELALDATPLQGLALEGSAQAIVEANHAALFSIQA